MRASSRKNTLRHFMGCVQNRYGLGERQRLMTNEKELWIVRNLLQVHFYGFSGFLLDFCCIFEVFPHTQILLFPDRGTAVTAQLMSCRPMALARWIVIVHDAESARAAGAQSLSKSSSVACFSIARTSSLARTPHSRVRHL